MSDAKLDDMEMRLASLETLTLGNPRAHPPVPGIVHDVKDLKEFVESVSYWGKRIAWLLGSAVLLGLGGLLWQMFTFYSALQHGAPGSSG